MKKSTFLLQFVLLALFILGAKDVSAYDFVSGGIYYSVNSTGATVENNGSFNTYSGNVTIPSSVTYSGNTYTVVSIGYQAFKGSTGLKSVTLPNTIMYLANESFYGCTSLTSINLPSSITAIYNNVFVNCSGLTSVYCNWETPKSFNVNNFSSSTYSSATLYVPAGKVSAYSSVAPWSSFSTIKEAPVSFTYNGISYFQTGDNTVKVIKKSSGNYSGSITIPSSVTYNGKTYSVTAIDEQAFRYATGMTSVSLPNTIVYMGYAAFSGSGLTSITLPNSLSSLDFSVFMDCMSLKTVKIGSGLKKLTAFTFIRCKALESISIPNTVTEISYEVFEDCINLKTVEIGSGVTSIDRYAFKGCTSLEKVICHAMTPPSLVSTTFDTSAYGSATLVVHPASEPAYKGANYWKNFTSISSLLYDYYVGGIYYKRISSNQVEVSCEDPINNTYSGTVVIPSSINVNGTTYLVTAIGGYAFYMCKSLYGVSIPSTVTKINECAFEGCSGLSAVVIPNSVTYLGVDAFARCTSLNSIDIPSSVTKIDQLAFSNCSGLTTVTLGAGVTNIAAKAFNGCSALTTISCLAATPPTMGNSDCFESSTYSSATLKVPGASLNAYKSADWWRKFNTISTLPFDFYVNGIYYKKISSNSVAVTYREILAESYTGNVNIPSSIKVNNVTYNVTAIGDYAFYMCKKVTAVNLPSSIISINSCAFEKCSGLTSVVIPNSVTTLGLDAFASCTGLRKIEIPASVTTIGDLAFYKCSGATTLTIGAGTKNIGEDAFNGCSALTGIVCNAVTPPVMKNKSCFDDNIYNSARLYVPNRSLSAYKSADWWRMFNIIIGGDFGGDPADVNADGEVNIADVNAVTDAILGGSTDSVYDVNGDNEVGISDINAVINAILSN